jgi:mRNA-degrading endonuclease RelE of RelBE toxin-antitoxin system
VTFEVKIETEAFSDLGNLTRPLLAEAYAALAQLKGNPLLGDALGNHPEVGDLSDCRKVYFNSGKHRIIYQLRPDDSNPRDARILAVGRRANLRVYRDAATRLGRIPGVDAPPK